MDAFERWMAHVDNCAGCERWFDYIAPMLCRDGRTMQNEARKVKDENGDKFNTAQWRREPVADEDAF